MPTTEPTPENLAAARELCHAFDLAMDSGSRPVQSFGIILASRIRGLLAGDVTPPAIPLDVLSGLAAAVEQIEES